MSDAFRVRPRGRGHLPEIGAQSLAEHLRAFPSCLRHVALEIGRELGWNADDELLGCHAQKCTCLSNGATRSAGSH